jgi:hypothetical protein
VFSSVFLFVSVVQLQYWNHTHNFLQLQSFQIFSPIFPVCVQESNIAVVLPLQAVYNSTGCFRVDV